LYCLIFLSKPFFSELFDNYKVQKYSFILPFEWLWQWAFCPLNLVLVKCMSQTSRHKAC